MSHHYASTSKGYDDGDYVGEEDDLDDDDAYDCLSDYEDDLEGAVEGSANGIDRRGENGGYSSRAHPGRMNGAGSSRHSSGVDLRRYRSASERGPPDHGDDNRRDHHNHLERKRRASIKGSYSDLRESIPSLRGSKASRAVTLQRAVEYIETLSKTNREHTMCVDALTRQNEILERQVQELHRSYQRMEDDEYSYAQATAAAQAAVAAATMAPSAPHTQFNASQSNPHPATLVVSTSSRNSSTGDSTPTATNAAPVLVANGSSSSSTTGGFSIPLRTVHSHQLSTDSNTSSPDDPPPVGPIPTTGLAQLSYVAAQLQHQQQSSLPSTNAAVVSLSGVSNSSTAGAKPAATTANTSLARLVTLDSSAPSASQQQQHHRVRLSNSLSVVNGGKPVVVLPATASSSSAGSAVDAAVVKARVVSRPAQDGAVVVGSNVEVVSSSTAAPSSAQPTRRVVIVSAQNHQDSAATKPPTSTS